MGAAFAHKIRRSHAETTVTLSQTRYAHPSTWAYRIGDS